MNRLAAFIVAFTCLPLFAQFEQLVDDLAPFEPFLGVWEINDQWSWETSLRAVSEYKPVLGGHAVQVRTWVSDGGGPIYERYRGFIEPSSTGFVLTRFDLEGSRTEIDLQVSDEGIHSEWSDDDGSQVRETLSLGDTGDIDWKVDIHNRGASVRAMDGEWQRRSHDELAQSLEAWERSELDAGFREAIDRRDLFEEEKSESEVVDSVEIGPGGRSMFVFKTTTIPSKIGPSRTMKKTIEFWWTYQTGGYQGTERSVQIAIPPSDKVAPTTTEMSSSETRRSAMPIDPSLFVASGSDLRSFTKTRTVNASAASIFAAWTTADVWARVYPEPSKAEIDLAIGGQYHWLFDGNVGSNGCQILSYIPDRMLSFTWNAPPTQPESRAKRTWVVVEIVPNEAGDACEVRLTHLGFGVGEHWDETYAYFDEAWESVLDAMERRLGRE